MGTNSTVPTRVRRMDGGGTKIKALEKTMQVARPCRPRACSVAPSGIKTGAQFASFMSALMADLVDGFVTPAVANAACNVGGKLLKVVEMQYKYGLPQQKKRAKILNLVG